MPPEDSPTDDRAERYAAAATPEERAVVVGHDFAFVRRRGAQLLMFILLFEVVVVAAFFAWVTASEATVNLVAVLVALFVGVFISGGTALLGAALSARENISRLQRTVISLGIDVVRVGLLVVAMSYLPAGLESLTFLVAGFAIGCGATINALVPSQLTRLIERADPRALVVADQLSLYPLWVTGLSRSPLPTVVTVIFDTAAWGASVLLIQATLWSVPLVLIVSVISGRLWLLGVARNSVRLAVGSSIFGALALALAVGILVPR